MTNFPGQNLNNLKSLDKKTNLNESFLAKTKSKLKNYLNNRRNIDFKNDKNYEYILQKSHRHYTFPIPLKKNDFSKETENFFDLLGGKLHIYR